MPDLVRRIECQELVVPSSMRSASMTPSTSTTMKTLDVRTRGAWRRWLNKHHGSSTQIWLVFHKRHTGRASISYDDAVEEALCFGWIDSLIKRLDDDRYARLFTPRRANSRWSTANRRRYADLTARGLLATAGLKRPPTGESGDVPHPPLKVPAYIMGELEKNMRARQFFEQLPPSSRRLYVGWIDSAKREETRQRRLKEALTQLAAAQGLGLK